MLEIAFNGKVFMKIMLLNDTGILPHIGCYAVSDAHVRMLARQGHKIQYRYFAGQLSHFYNGDEEESISSVLNDHSFMDQLIDVDAVVVNGEGTIHHGSGMEYLSILAVAQQLGKKTLIVNAVFQESYGFLDVFRKLDDFCVREILSSEFATKLGIKNRIIIDSFIEAQFDFSEKPYIDLSNKIVVTDWNPARNFDVGTAMRTYMDENKGNCFFYPLVHGIHQFTWKKAPAALSTCNFIITGRHHGIYLAAAAKKPFVPMSSNTHKIEGLIKMSGVNIPICSDLAGLAAGIDFCKCNKSAYDEFFAFIDSYKPLTTFSSLGFSKAKSPNDMIINLESDSVCNSINHLPEFWSLSNIDRNYAAGMVFKVLKEIMNKRVVFWGTGSCSQELCDVMPVKISYFVDNEPKKITTEIQNLSVKAPQILQEEERDNLAIIIASQYYEEISKQLEEWGFIPNKHFWNGFNLLRIMKTALRESFI